MLTLQFTDRAEGHLVSLAQWWAEHRPKSQRQVLEEVEQATSLLCESPGIGKLYENKRGREIRRFRVGKTPYYLYYLADIGTSTLVVLALWSAMRGVGPDL